ncbi:hypothetical protein AB0D67_33935 [Streptosporangium sp. NPDC048047]
MELAATLRFRERDALRGIVNAGHTEARVAVAAAAILRSGLHRVPG